MKKGKDLRYQKAGEDAPAPHAALAIRNNGGQQKPATQII
jgi:hypothetical protein